MEPSPEIAGEAGPALARVIMILSRRPGTTEPPTLGRVREAIADGLLQRLQERGEVDLDLARAEAVEQEVERLVERFGEDILAEDFVRYRAGPALSEVIRAVMRDHDDPERPPTLAQVAEAMRGGLVARLIGEGALDGDDQRPLDREIEGLIDLHGPAAPAEHYLT